MQRLELLAINNQEHRRIIQKLTPPDNASHYSCTPPADENSQWECDHHTSPNAAGGKIHRIPFDRIDDRVVEEVRAVVDGKYLPPSILFDRVRGPPAFDIESAVILLEPPHVSLRARRHCRSMNYWSK
jgi:hypothetical protein